MQCTLLYCSNSGIQSYFFTIQPECCYEYIFRAKNRYTMMGVVQRCSDSLLRVLEVLYCMCLTEKTLVSPLNAHNNIATLRFLTCKLRFNWNCIPVSAWYSVCTSIYSPILSNHVLFTFYPYFSHETSHIWPAKITFIPLYDSQWLAHSLLNQTLSLLWTYSLKISEMCHLSL